MCYFGCTGLLHQNLGLVRGKALQLELCHRPAPGIKGLLCKFDVTYHQLCTKLCGEDGSEQREAVTQRQLRHDRFTY